AETSSVGALQQVLWISLIAMCFVFLVRSGPRLVRFAARCVPSRANASATAAGLSARAAEEPPELAEFATAFRVIRPAGASVAPASVATSPGGPPAFSFASGESEIQAMIRTFCRLSTTSDEASQQQALRALSSQVTPFKDRTTAPELLPLWQIAAALEGLLKHLMTKAEDVTPSTLKTTSN